MRGGGGGRLARTIVRGSRSDRSEIREAVGSMEVAAGFRSRPAFCGVQFKDDLKI